MGLIIAKKLDLLMMLTDTPNNILGKALSFDASYISRIRTGKRGIPKQRDFIEPAANYFARIIRQPNQIEVLSQRINQGKGWPDDVEESAQLLKDWLNLGDESFDYFTVNTLPPVKEIEPSNSEAITFFYGNKGKRESVELLLSEICELDKPANLLLYSDEDMTWLYEDEKFAKRWAQLLMKLTAKGGKIKIIHSIKRNVGEMLQAIKKWLPLYATNAIQPYYCPRVRDNIYRRTLFIAKNHFAIISNSIGDNTKGMLNILIRDVKAVQALENEFNNYLAICRPLLKIYNMSNIEEFRLVYEQFVQSESETIIYSSDGELNIPLCELLGLEPIKKSRIMTPENTTSFNLIVNETVGVMLYNSKNIKGGNVLYTNEQDITAAILEYLIRND